MLLRRPKYHRFEYIPRFFNPERDEDGRRKQKMRIARAQQRRKRRPVLLWVALFGLLFYLYYYFSGVFR